MRSNIGKLIGLLLFLLLTEASAKTSIQVTNARQLVTAVATANAQGNTEIILADGEYQLANTLFVQASGITLRSASGHAKKVVLRGRGMQQREQVDNLILVGASHFTLDAITLAEAGNHLVQVLTERNADHITLKNCILRDSFQQLVKVSAGGKSGHSSDNGKIENCTFYYSAGIGPQWYIGGIDAHRAQNWLIKNNRFFDIASPSRQHAEYAIHFWNQSAGNQVIDNLIVNCDRGIGFGLGPKGNQGGLIANNLILHVDKKDPFADVGIAVQSSPDTQIKNNRIYLAHRYRYAIEVTGKTSQNVLVEGNISNKRITNRKGGKGKRVKNKKLRKVEKVLTEQQLNTVYTPLAEQGVNAIL